MISATFLPLPTRTSPCRRAPWPPTSCWRRCCANRLCVSASTAASAAPRRAAPTTPDMGCIFIGEAAAHINPEMGRRNQWEEALEQVREPPSWAAGMIGHLVDGRLSLGSSQVLQLPGHLLLLRLCWPAAYGHAQGGRGLPQGHEAAGRHRHKGTDAAWVDGTCAKQCFMGAIRVEEARAVHDESQCRPAGACAVGCAQRGGGVRLRRGGQVLLDLYRRVKGTTNIR